MLKLTIKFIFLSLFFSFFLISFFPLTASAATLSRPPSNLGLVGYWPLDEGNGVKATDASWNGNTGTIYNGTAWTNGTHGKALDFNQPTTYPRIGVADSTKLNFGTGDFSISMWGKHRDFTYPKAWFMAKKVNACFNAGNVGWDMGHGYYSTGMQFCMNDGTTIVSTNAVFDAGFQPSQLLNKWVHLTAVVDRTAGRVKFYVNGVKQTNEINISSVTGSISNNNALDVGTLYGWQTDGVLDDIKIYNRALSASEVSKTYSSGQVTRKQTSSSGLVGYWSMDDNAGNKATDSSGNNNTGTIVGATWTNGKKGKALSFNGSSDYIDFGSSSNLQLAGDLTLSAWVYPTNVDTGRRGIIISKRHGYQIGINNGNGTTAALCYEGYTGTNWNNNFCTTNIIYPNNWYHVSVTFVADGQAVLYVNGVAATNKTMVGGHGGFSQNLIAGWDSVEGWGTPPYFAGKIDDVRIYNRALSATEIQNLYKQNQTVMNASQNNKLTNGLVGFWSFNGKDVSGSTVYDRSGNGYNGTTTGATLTIGKSGQAMSFRGFNSGTYVDLGNNSALNPANFTISAWAKPGDFSGSYGYIYSNARDCCGSYKGIEFWFVSNKLNVQIWNTTAAGLTSNASIPNTSDWVLVTASYDGSNLRLYINGALDNITATTLGVGTPASYNSAIGGMGMAPGTYTINGSLDEVRLYNRALTPLEIKQLYNMGR